VRRAALALTKASDLDEMFEATRYLLDFGEFSFANAQVGQPGRRVFWSWSRTNGGARPRTEWSLRLPLVKDEIEWGWVNLYRGFDNEPLLVDTNYLIDLFRREFTDAAATILTRHEIKEPVRHDLQDYLVNPDNPVNLVRNAKAGF
jgi:hypothetical protein